MVMTHPSTKITPSVKRTLAYVYAFGWMPSHIHANTYCAVMDMTESEHQFSDRFKRVRDEYVHHIANEPIKMAHDYLIAQRFIIDRGNQSFKRTGHYIRYHRLNDDNTEDTAISYRSGDYVDIYPGGSYRNRQRIALKRNEP
jgi:hypothetical protein